jgi:uncharacterized protein YdeI (YjbR/CyaY-like superfamily)
LPARRTDEDEVVFFESPAAFRRWLRRHHASATVLWVGFRKRATGLPTLTWPQSVDEALCFGWIDGVRKSIDETSYKIRFSPRRPGSVWSRINVARVGELVRLGLMQPAGQAAFERRIEAKSGVYSYEQRHTAELSPEYLGKLRANRKAAAFLEARPPFYRQGVARWVMSAKREETRERRLAQLIEDCAAGRLIGSMNYAKR